MYNVFQQPWLLLGVSFLLLVVVYVMRTSFPEKQKWWHLLVPVFVIALAIGLDYFVMTDKEKVKSVIENAIDATVDKDAAALAPLIAEDYRDRQHISKKAIMTTFQYHVKSYSIKSITMTSHEIDVDGETAEAEILVRVRMNPSNTSMPAPNMAYAKIKLIFKKKPDQTWVIKSTQLIEVNKTPANWKTY
jgi:hypothetical protein